MTPKLLQNRGANEATPTQCFLHLSRNPSNKTTFACGWPPLGDPAVILWASRTHTLQDAGRAEQQLPFSRIWALVGGLSILQFDITAWTDFCVFSSGSGTALVAAVHLSLHTYWCEMSRELQHLQPPACTQAGSWLWSTARCRGQPLSPKHSAPLAARAAGRLEEGWHTGNRRQALGSGISYCSFLTACIVFCFAYLVFIFIFCSTKSCYLNCEWIERPWVIICIWKGLVRTA